MIIKAAVNNRKSKDCNVRPYFIKSAKEIKPNNPSTTG